MNRDAAHEETIRHALAAADCYRIGCEAEASDHVTNLIDGLTSFTASLSAESVSRLAGIIQPLLDAQERKDFSYVADLLQYELVPFLDQITRTSRP